MLNLLIDSLTYCRLTYSTEPINVDRFSQS
jgi:hypothetical protein